MRKNALELPQGEACCDAPLLVDGESCSECEAVCLPELDDLVIRQKITSTDNHIRHMPDGYVVLSFVLTRTLSVRGYAKPKHAAKGFTWYIRQSPTFGGQAIAYFKDVKMALEVLETLEKWEILCAGRPVHDLNKLRRLLVLDHSWALLHEL